MRRRAPSLAALLMALALVACGDRSEPGAATDVASAPPDDASITLSSENPDGLQATIDVEQQAVRGRFRRLRFEASLTGTGQAIASFERISGMTLIATIGGPKTGTLEWRGTTLDGFGPATAEEQEVMAHYADRLKADELALIPLDLACRPGADELDPAVGAALVLPWQILLKYQPQGEIPTPAQAAAASQCQHLLSPTDAVDPQRTPSPSVVALLSERPVPMAIGYLPLDREGVSQATAGVDDANE